MESKPLITPGLRGMDLRWEAPPVCAQVVQDMRWDGRGFWTSAGGFGLIAQYDNQETVTNPFTGVGRINSLHFFSQHNGARSWIIYEAGTTLYTFNPSTAFRNGSPGDIAEDRSATQQTNRANPSTPWQHSQSCTWGDNFYIVNGINQPLVFDGYCWDYAGFSQGPGAPSVVVLNSPHASTMGGIKLTMMGLGPTSDTADVNYKVGYRYRVSFINSRGQESPLSTPSELVTFENEGGTLSRTAAHFVLVNLPIGGPETVGRRVYRTQNVYDSTGTAIQGYADQFFYLRDVQDNMTTSFMDGQYDSTLGTPVDPLDFGPFPIGAKYIAPFKGCMFAAGSTETSVFYSAPNQPENFPVDNILPVGDAYLGPITGLYGTRNALIVFKEWGIYFITGDPTNGFVASLFTKTTGCVAPGTIREVPGLGVAFLGASGVYLLRGTLQNEGVQTQIVPWHVPITPWIKKLNRAALIGATASVYHRDKEYWLAVPTTGHDENDLVLVYHYEIAEWSYRENYPISCMLETADHRGHLLFGSWDVADNEGIYVYSPGWQDKNGVSIDPMYQSGWYNVGAIWRAMRPKYVMAQIGLHGSNGLVMQSWSNRSLTAWPDQPAQPQQYREEVQPVYNTATFDSGTAWQALRPGTKRFDITDAKKAYVHEFSFALTPETGKRWLSVVAFDPEISVDDPSGQKPSGPRSGGS